MNYLDIYDIYILVPHSLRFEDMVTRNIAAEQIVFRSTVFKVQTQYCCGAEQILINYI